MHYVTSDGSVTFLKISSDHKNVPIVARMQACNKLQETSRKQTNSSQIYCCSDVDRWYAPTMQNQYTQIVESPKKIIQSEDHDKIVCIA